ncbi:class I SAM-dependent methyltransferase [Panacibacter sp. DH6]|uniref:Class I SAM-dependent methyltransferase n=1 Tax=Panacibacter microcysteis TaxID=2793269 RepID=A0A931GYP6_9BACT|nr:class I SAM-dependent methyltransferase [Panacibacter microcysteis]MBG9377097.1 class I SAM-dependent methyltransferase [Panacibacter microcysteis]
MLNDQQVNLPAHYLSIKEASAKISFSMPSDLQTGCLLRTLVAAKPNGTYLELGTGTGLSLAWMVEGMTAQSTLITIDTSETYQAVAKVYFGKDKRVQFVSEDAANWITANRHKKFDLVFADAWPGKYELLNETLNMLNTGGLYIIDDMLPQPNWPAGHEKHVERLIKQIEANASLQITKLNWSTGIVIVTKNGILL